MDNKAAWLEIALTINGELAEAVSDVLARYMPNGVVVEGSYAYLNAEDEGQLARQVRVYGYLPVDDNLEENRQRILEALWHLGQIQPLPEPTFTFIENQDWMAAWKKNYRPIPIGKKLLILPAWLEPADPSRTVVRLDPSMAFGTGTHPTTQLCLEAVENYVQPGQPVIDVGCGSGILSIAALKLGASHALAVDIDADSVRVSRENAEDNAVLSNMEIGSGSVDEVLEGKFSIQTAPLVLANILAPIILRLLDAGLAKLVAPGGTLVLSGILDEQARGVIEKAQSCGLRLVETRQINDWVALIFA